MVFDRLREGIRKFAGLGLATEKEVDELIKEIQRALLIGDVEVDVVSEISRRLKKEALKPLPKGITRKEFVLNLVYKQLEEIVGVGKPPTELIKKGSRILLFGLFGSGKTTTTGKLANFYRKRGYKVGVIGADVHRPAAMEQLEQLSAKIKVDFYGAKEKSAEKIVNEGLKKFKGYDLIILDSAGRDSMDSKLSEELKKISEVFKPDQKYLVVSADIGQSAGEQASRFNELIGIDGIIITKMESSAKGGGAITSCVKADAQVAFLGTGEGLDDIRLYNPAKFVGNILGVPDMESLIEKAKQTLDVDKAKKFIEGDFTLKDFVDQIGTASSSGMFDQVMDILPFKKKIEGAFKIQKEKAKKYEHIIKSMTAEEIADPKSINRSRAQRIASGSGTSVEEVRELIKYYKQARNMMNKFCGKASPKKLKKIIKQLGLSI